MGRYAQARRRGSQGALVLPEIPVDFVDLEAVGAGSADAIWSLDVVPTHVVISIIRDSDKVVIGGPFDAGPVQAGDHEFDGLPHPVTCHALFIFKANGFADTPRESNSAAIP